MTAEGGAQLQLFGSVNRPPQGNIFIYLRVIYSYLQI